MIAVDSNILVYAHRRDSPHHATAHRSLSELAEHPAPWAIAWPCVHEFLNIVTHPRIYRPPSTIEQAVLQIDAWMASPSLVLIGEADGYWVRLREGLLRSKVIGPRVHDARVAEICAQHGVTKLWSADRDFGRFPVIALHNPLV